MIPGNEILPNPRISRNEPRSDLKASGFFREKHDTLELRGRFGISLRLMAKTNMMAIHDQCEPSMRPEQLVPTRFVLKNQIIEGFVCVITRFVTGFLFRSLTALARSDGCCARTHHGHSALHRLPLKRLLHRKNSITSYRSQHASDDEHP